MGVGGLYALVPDDFTGVKPKVVVKEGDHVKVGDALFVNKNCPEVQFASPVSGEVTAVLRGDRRKLLRVVVKADGEQQYASFGSCDLSSLDGEGVKAKLHLPVALWRVYYTHDHSQGYLRERVP